MCGCGTGGTLRRLSGDLAAAIELTRANGKVTDYAYRMLGANGGVIETGIAKTVAWAQPLATIDFTASSGATSSGVYDAADTSMQLALQ